MSETPPGPQPKPRIPKLEDFPETGPNALAALNQRAWARLIDGVIVLVPFIMLLIIMARPTLGPDLQATAATEDMNRRLEPIIAIGTLVVGAIYETIAIAWKGQTIGKSLLGVRVARYADGKRPDLGQAALRGLLPALGGAVTFATMQVSTLGVILVLGSAYFLPLRRGWQDLAGGTVVIRTR